MFNLGRFIFKMLGWKVVGSLPPIQQYVLIVAPHTSNWDLIIGLCASFDQETTINFLAKHQLFFFPLGAIFRAMGGTPVNRTQSMNRVEQTVALFKEHKSLKLGLAPEGTRHPVTRWKEGFYHMACAANVPIVMVGMDYPTKEVRVHEVFWPTKDIAQDFETMLTFFRTIKGKYPKVIPDYQPKENTRS